METISALFEYISRTNLFNFIIFASVIFFVAKKIDVNNVLENMKFDIIDKIEKSKEAKEKSDEYLKDMEDVISFVGEEIDNIINKSDNNAKLIGEKILEEADIIVENIKDNSQKLVDNKTALLKNDILKRASEASIEVAKNHIINELNNNYDLHNKFIDECIEAIEEVKI